METFFLEVVNLSVTASWVIAVVLLLRLLLWPVPKKICVSAVAGGVVSPAVSGDVGKPVQLGTAAPDHSAGDCVYHAAGADCCSAGSCHCR